MATSSNTPPPHQNHHPHHYHQLNSSPDPAAPLRLRARKPTKAGPNGPKKQCQRGKGVAELERLLRQQQQQQQQHIQSNPQQQQLLLHQANPLAGVPVHPGRLAHLGLSAQWVGPTDDQYSRFALEYPDQHLQRYLDEMKKKRMMMGEVGFMNGQSGTHSGGAYQDMNMFNNGDNSNNAYYLALNGGVSQPNHAGASEVVAIHKKGNGSTIVMMKEYEFFPNKSEVKEDNSNLNLNLGITTTTNTNYVTSYYTSSVVNNDNTNYNNNYYNTITTTNHAVEDNVLTLQMSGLDRDHSSSSSLSSLSDPPPTTTNGRLDLSLRL